MGVCIMTAPLKSFAHKNILESEEGGWKLQISDTGVITNYQTLNNENHKTIPFRKGQWGGPSWYVRSLDGKSTPVKLQKESSKVLSFSGLFQGVRFGINYKKVNGVPAAEVTIRNESEVVFLPMTAGIRIGVDSYQEKFPTWNSKLMPNVMRCEPTHHWGFAMSPSGNILGWVCPQPTASYSINFQPRAHRVYTANIDFINQLPLPNRHPQNLTSVKPGECKRWTILFSQINHLKSVKQTISKLGQVPIFDAEYYTIRKGEKTCIRIFGPKVRRLSMKLPLGGETTLLPIEAGKSFTEYIFSENESGLYTLRAECENGKIAEGTIFVRHDWKWYLEKARLEGLRVKPTQTHHAECIYPFFSYYLGKKHIPNAEIDEECEKVFQKYFPLHYNFKTNELKVNWRIQDTAVWAGVLADRYAATGDIKSLEYAAHLCDYLINKKQGKDGAFYMGVDYSGHGKTHYTSVIYLAKSIMEVMKEEKKLVKSSPIWQDRYNRHAKAVERAINDLAKRRDNVQTEGQQTYEDGMISCSLTQLAMYALKNSEKEDITKYVQVAEALAEGHRSLTVSQHPDARVNGSTIRFWETQYTICLMSNMYNSPCGWSAWKLYGTYYLYLLTGKEEYLKQTFNGLGACVQLIDWQSGRLRWGFTPDPFIYTKWAVPAKYPDSKREHDWVTGVRGEEYLEHISDWNRSKKIWRNKWGIDTFSHEIFKCMEEALLENAYVIERADGTIKGYNCTVKISNEILEIKTTEEMTSRIHLNLRKQQQIRAEIGKTKVKGSFKGRRWIGPGGVPEDIRPM